MRLDQRATWRRDRGWTGNRHKNWTESWGLVTAKAAPSLILATLALTVLVSVVACGSLHRLTGESATAASSATTATPIAASSPTASTPPTVSGSDPATALLFSGVDWASLSYPVSCGGQTVGLASAYTSPEPTAHLAVVMVSCRAGAGSPPSAVLVFDNSGPAGAPKLRQTLLSYQDDWLPAKDETTVSGNSLSVTVYGYSRASIPHCCPDIHTTLTWSWSGGTYMATGPAPTHVQLPAS